MLGAFTAWADVIEHVRGGGSLYYVPYPDAGPCPTIARIRQTTQDGPLRLWLRCPDNFRLKPYPSTIADESFMDKLYRWEAAKASRR